MDIKELREITGQTQKEFAARFGIPVGTLRRWEYGESTPAPYIVELIACQLTIPTKKMKKIQGEDGTLFYYEKETHTIIDVKGTKIPISEDLNEVNEHNLLLYARELFESYYELIDDFERSCKRDKKVKIEWI